MRAKRNRTGLLAVFLSLVFRMMVCATVVHSVHVSTQAAAETIPSLQADGNVKTGTIIDPEGRQKELGAIVEERMVAFFVNTTPFMINGRGKTSLYIENPSKNGDRFIMTIIRGDTGGEIYRSGYLDPGQYIGEATLDVELDRGEYAYTVNFDTYRIRDNFHIGRAAVWITLYVLG